jgi:hypothetical protein
VRRTGQPVLNERACGHVYCAACAQGQLRWYIANSHFPALCQLCVHAGVSPLRQASAVHPEHLHPLQQTGAIPVELLQRFERLHLLHALQAAYMQDVLPCGRQWSI